MSTPTVLACQPSSSLSLQYPVTLDPGLAAYPIATGLAAPRHLLIDSADNILVIDRGRGVVALTESDDCAGYEQRLIVQDATLNTGIGLAGDTLYASSTDVLYAWTYNATDFTTSNQRTLITGMGGSSHDTRTIVLEPGTASPSYVILGRGSDGNIDTAAQANDRAQIRRFALSDDATSVAWTDGELLASGIRNAVGMSVSPDLQNLWIVENSADNLVATTGEDVHNTNPAEDVNVVDLASAGGAAGWYGYPSCFTVFDGSLFDTTLTTGTQFSIESNVTDAQCDQTSIGPRLGLPAHYAPLDIKFLTATNTSFPTSWRGNAIVTSHGSWDADPPAGYAVLRIPFETDSWQPVAASDSQTGFDAFLAAPDQAACGQGHCFRPVGVAIERSRPGENGLFVSSDATGEIVRVYQGKALARSAAATSRRARLSLSFVSLVVSGVLLRVL